MYALDKNMICLRTDGKTWLLVAIVPIYVLSDSVYLDIVKAIWYNIDFMYIVPGVYGARFFRARINTATQNTEIRDIYEK